MNFLKRKFTNYAICYYANDKDNCIAKINCYDKDQKVEKYLGKVLSPILTIKFFENDSEIPPNRVEEYYPAEDLIKKYGPIWKIKLHYPIGQFNDIISILRHEGKTFYLIIEKGKDNPKGGLITEGLTDDDKYEYFHEELD